MPTTFSVDIPRDSKRRDGTYNVKIRVTHDRKVLRVATNLYVTDADMTRGWKLKNAEIIDATDERIRSWRSIVNRMGAASETMDVRTLVERIKDEERGGNAFRLDFIDFGRKVAAKKNEGTARTYNTALNCLERFMTGRVLDVSDVTAKFLDEFEAFIRTEPVQRYSPKHGRKVSEKSKDGGRAVSLYLANIRHIHNEAKKRYNDEDKGVIPIPGSPFKKYELKKPPRTKKKAVPRSVIQAIIDLPDAERPPGSWSGFTRRDLARDCFLMSFALAGMNAVDLYDAGAQDLYDDIIRYKRKKTRTRRDDEAEMHIRVERCIALLVEKYRDPTGRRLFCFHRHYGSMVAFNVALRLGLEKVRDAIGAEHFTFYSARHSYATISRSKVLNIDKYTIHEGLNHVDPDMKVTDGYIERDYGNIWDANARLLALFNWSKLETRELLR